MRGRGEVEDGEEVVSNSHQESAKGRTKGLMQHVYSNTNIEGNTHTMPPKSRPRFKEKIRALNGDQRAGGSVHAKALTVPLVVYNR